MVSRLSSPTAKRLFVRALVASLCATAALAIGILLLGDFEKTPLRILATTALISLYSLFALPAGVLLDRRRLVPLAWTVIGLAAGGFLLALALVWGAGGDALGKLVVTVTAFGGAGAQFAMLTARRRADDSAPVRRLYGLAAGAAALLALLISIAAWAEIEDETYYRALGAVAVVNVLLAVLQPVLRRSARSGGLPAQAYRFVCGFDGVPARLPPDGFRSLGEGRIECELEAADFAAALARAVRAIERQGGRVRTVERL